MGRLSVWPATWNDRDETVFSACAISGERLLAGRLEVGLALVEEDVVVEREDDAPAPHVNADAAGVDHLLELGDELVEERCARLGGRLLLAELLELRG